MRYALAAGFSVFYLALMGSCHRLTDAERLAQTKRCVDAGMIPIYDRLDDTVTCRIPDKEHK